MGAEKKSAPFSGRPIRGFTLMELMIVLSLAAVILALGAPNFREFSRNNRLTTGANDLLASIQLTRTEAILRQLPVSLCASADPRSPGAVCGGGDFGGWIVFADTDGDCARDPGEPLIRQEGPLDRRIASSTSGACISIGGNGFLRNVPGVATANRILYCDDRGTTEQRGTGQSAARGLQVSRSGRAEVTRDIALISSWGLGCAPPPA
jgi:type IV fimbrial biogenesis protein FimT